MMMSRRLSGLILLLLFLAAPLGAATIYVPDDYATIQGAIQAAVQGDIIRVRPGTYPENIDFLGKAITVNSLQGPETTTIDAAGSGSVVVFINGEGAGSVLRGFTLVNGIGTFDQAELRTLGGGILSREASPTIENCQLEENTADHGGGIYTESASPLITDCTLVYNQAEIGGGIFCKLGAPRITDCHIAANTVDWFGGGIYSWEASPVVTGCTLTINETSASFDGGGGGMYIYGASNPVIAGNVLAGNITPGPGGGICCAEDSSAVIKGNYFNSNQADDGGGIHCLFAGSVLITGNVFTGNESSGSGGGIYTQASDTVIRGNTILFNTSTAEGGGIAYIDNSGPENTAEISRNQVNNNSAVVFGGIYCLAGKLRMVGNRVGHNSASFGGGVGLYQLDGGLLANNVIHDNEVNQRGGGIVVNQGGELILENNTITGNSVVWGGGGGLYCYDGTTLTVVHGIFWGNSAPEGKEIYLDYDSKGLSLDIDYCDVDGGIGSLVVETGCTLNWGEGMIDADPLFVTGPAGSHYLSQTAAGQAVNSPCVDVGDPAAGGASGTTRTDAFSDLGVADLGMHYTSGSLVAGAGPGEANPPTVRLFPLQQDAVHDLEFPAYGADSYGVNVHAGDLDGDGLDEIITGAGPGEVYGPHVRGFDSDGQPIPGVSFLAYGTNRFGVNVALGDLDGDGRDEIITGAGPGEVFGPHVRAFDVNEFPPGTAAIPGVSFMAYATHRWGVNVACGDIDGDGFDEIVTGAGPGAVFGPHVRGWNVDNASSAAIPTVSYFAYGTNKYGVRVSCGDVDGDGIDEIITAPGPSSLFGPHLRGWNYDGAAVAPIAGCSFFALPPAQYSYGAQLFTGADLDGDGRAELVVGAGPGPGADSKVVVYRYDGAAVSQWLSLLAMPSAWRYGATVAAGRF